MKRDIKKKKADCKDGEGIMANRENNAIEKLTVKKMGCLVEENTKKHKEVTNISINMLARVMLLVTMRRMHSEDPGVAQRRRWKVEIEDDGNDGVRTSRATLFFFFTCFSYPFSLCSLFLRLR